MKAQIPAPDVTSNQPGSRSAPWLIMAITMLAATNIRTGLVGFAPILPLVQEDLELTYSLGGLVQAIPIVFMGVFSAVGGFIVSKWGSKSLVSWGLLFIVLGNLGRGLAMEWLLLLLTSVLFGVGLGLTQSAMPYMTKQLFPNMAGTATGMYTGGMLTGTLAGAALTLPVLVPLSGAWSWRGTLFIWAIWAAICLIPWWFLVPKIAVAANPPKLSSWIRSWRQWKAWHVALIFGLQTILFNTYTAWIPTFYHDAGIDPTSAFTMFNLVALPITFFMPLISDWIGQRRPLLIAASFSALIITIVHVVWYDTWFVAWSGLLGAANTTLFSISLVLAVDVSNKEEVGSISALVLLFGYAVSAGMTPIIGLLRDMTGDFAIGLLSIWVPTSVLLIILSWMVPKHLGQRVEG